MRPKASLKFFTYITSLGVVALSSAVVFFPNFYLPNPNFYNISEYNTGQTQPNQMGNTQNESSGINLFVDPIISDLPASSMPTRLKIPKINVDASLEPVGLTTDGAMDVPKNQDSVAWLKLGPRPGEIGSAVMAGHYGWKDQKPSAFDNLYKLRQGDKLYVENDQGETISFVVHNIRRYKQDDKIANVFHSNDKKSHLNLITCEGTWNDISKSYPIRLVVFCDKE